MTDLLEPVLAPPLGDALARLIGRAGVPGSEIGVGIEHEYRVESPSGRIDWRSVAHERVGPVGRRLDPVDPYAYRCGWGGVLTADGREAEVAMPPQPVRPGVARAVVDSAATGRGALAALLAPGERLWGFSTHLNVSVEPRWCAPVCRLFARTFAPAVMLCGDGADGLGLLVRPRWGRVELGLSYVDGARLGASAVLAAGTVQACRLALAGDEGARAMLPAPLRADVEDAYDRFGWYVDRRAFGGDLYRSGRATPLVDVHGRVVEAQDRLRAASQVARSVLASSVGPGDLAWLDALVEGAMALPCEFPVAADVTDRPRPGPGPVSPWGRLLGRRHRRGFDAEVAVATWGYAVWWLGSLDRSRTLYAAVPARALGEFLDALDAGALDDAACAALALPAQGRVLARHAQAVAGGVFDTLVLRTTLAAPERDAVGVARPAAAVPGPAPARPAPGAASAAAPGALVAMRPGKASTVVPAAPTGTPAAPPPPSAGNPGRPGRRTWWPWVVGLAVLLVLIGAVVVRRGTSTTTTVAPSTTPAVATTTAPAVQTTAPVQTTAAPAAQTTAPAVQATAAPVVQTTAPPVVQTTAAPVVQTTAPPVVQTTAPAVQTTAATVPPTTTGPLVSGPYEGVVAVADDPAGHACCVFPSTRWEVLQVRNTQTGVITIRLSGIFPGLTIAATIPGTGDPFSASGTTTVAGFAGTEVRFSGTVTPAGGVVGTLVVGGNGTLPTGRAITFAVDLRKAA